MKNKIFGALLSVSFLMVAAFSVMPNSANANEQDEGGKGYTDPDECTVYIGPIPFSGSKIECHPITQDVCDPSACSRNPI